MCWRVGKGWQATAGMKAGKDRQATAGMNGHVGKGR
jgi:hypothetical protein